LALKRDAADGAVDSWIETLSARNGNGAPARAAKDHVRYAIDVREHYYVPAFRLSAFAVTGLRTGDPGATRAVELRTLAQGTGKHLVPLDRIIGRLVNASGLIGGLQAVSPTILGTLMDLLMQTDRLHWRSVHEPALRRESMPNSSVVWRIDEDGRQRPHLDGHPRSILLPVAPLWYVDPARGTAGPAGVEMDPEVAAAIASAPSLTAEQARRAQVALRGIFASAGTEGPQADIGAKIVDADPVPLLFLEKRDGVATAELTFLYGDIAVHANDATSEFRSLQHGETIVRSRRKLFEADALERLSAVGFAPLLGSGQSRLRMPEPEEDRWINFLSEAAPRLRLDGWRIDEDPEFPYVLLEPDDEWDADLTQAEARWFELDLGIDVQGTRIPLLPILVDVLAAGGPAPDAQFVVARLPNGGHVALPADRIARLLATLGDLFDDPSAFTDDGKVRVPSVRAAELAALEATLSVNWDNVRPLRDLFEALQKVEDRPIELPANFHAVLRPYQRDGVAWLQALREHGFGGVLADDMGLGKTVQLLAHVAIEKAAGRLSAPVLVVAPTSVVPNWRSEIARFTPELKVVSLTGADRLDRLPAIDDADIVLTSFALLPRDAEHLLERRWSIAVLDEAQNIKNPRAKAAMASRSLHAEQCIALTGTPIENHLEELWSIYAFAVPGLLSDRSRFARLFRTPIEKKDDSVRRTALAVRIRPFLLRRTKERVASELPEKTEVVQRVELAGEQRDLYETIRLAMHKRVRDEVGRRGLARSRIVVLDALLKLRQVCCDPRLLKLPAAAGVTESAKLEALLEMLESLIEDGRRVLLFSQFTSMLDLIKPELHTRNLPFVELRGETRDRETPVNRFQAKEVPLFLISLKAGGTGLNLTAADTVIHYDPWWNPAVERQATDRAHRIGQTQHVFVYKFIAEGTVEERILEMQERKGALAESLFDETAAAPLRLEMSDLESLFS